MKWTAANQVCASAACVLLGASALLGQGIDIIQDDRGIEVSAENLGIALDGDFDSPDTVGQPWSPSIHAAIGGASASATQASTTGTFILVGRGDAIESASAPVGTTMYSSASSYYQVRFAVAAPIPFSLTGTIRANHGGTSLGNACASVSLRGDSTGTLVTHELFVDEGDEVQPFDELGVLLPDIYWLEVRASSNTTEIEFPEAGAGIASFEFEFDTGDRDHDGLLDIWETDGIDVNGDGTVDLDLPALGADPDHKDLFVEVDAMVGRAPDPTVKTRVEAAFAAVPEALVNNPDNQNGISLHFLQDEVNIPLTAFPNRWTEFDAVKTAHFGTAVERADPNWVHIRAARLMAFRYCVFAQSHSGGTSSGFSELPGNDFTVTLGLWNTPGGTPDQQVGTFMHEFGHSLNLKHGGGDHINRKPNYYSIMSYTWQLPQSGYDHLWRLDYSSVALAALDEAELLEVDGIDGSDGPFAQRWTLVNTSDHPPALDWFHPDGQPIDFDASGSIDGGSVAADLNYHYPARQSPSPGQVLKGHNDWSQLWYHLTGHPDFGDGIHTSSTADTEITREDFEAQNTAPAAPIECVADWNGDTLVNTGDFLDYLNDYNAVRTGQPFTFTDPDLATPVGVLNTADFLAFLNAFNAGCP